MKETPKALLIGVLSRLLVIAVVILASFLIVPTGNIVASHSNLPVISLFDRWDSAYYVSIAKNGYPLDTQVSASGPTNTLMPTHRILPLQDRSGLFSRFSQK